jgi:L-alanine-DL-glutamate epimerase-like enolase superfamily enzyme
MKIKDIKIQVVEREIDLQGADITHGGVSHLKGMAEVPVLRVVTDGGIEGTSFGRDGLRLAQYLHSLKPLLLGEDPLYVERIWQRMWTASRMMHLPDTALGTIDIAIWDIIGKAANLPIYQLLGAYRDKVRAYASSGQYPDAEAYVRQALDLKARGFTAYKLHVSGVPDEDLRVCRAVREAVGEDMILMHDAVGLYSREQALRVGRELEKLNFYWFEEPIQDTDMDGLVQLCNALDIPIATLEVLPGTLYTRAQYIARGAVDIVRSDTLYNAGITPLKKTASLAEAFGMKCEIHCNPNPLANAANLHVICSIKNCDFYEWMVPESVWNFGVKETIKLDNQGYVHVPKGPGLGLEVDWEYIDSHTTASFG